MVSPRTFTLPVLEVMRRRLRDLDSSPHVMDHLHPMILHYAGTPVSASGIVFLLDFAFKAYMTMVPLPTYPEKIWMGLYLKALVSDPLILKEALEKVEQGTAAQ